MHFISSIFTVRMSITNPWVWNALMSTVIWSRTSGNVNWCFNAFTDTGAHQSCPGNYAPCHKYACHPSLPYLWRTWMHDGNLLHTGADDLLDMDLFHPHLFDTPQSNHIGNLDRCIDFCPIWYISIYYQGKQCFLLHCFICNQIPHRRHNPWKIMSEYVQSNIFSYFLSKSLLLSYNISYMAIHKSSGVQGETNSFFLL